MRVNPGNIKKFDDKVGDIAKAAKDAGIPIRIGVNAGSLDKRLLAKYGKATPEALVESALWECSLFEEHDFRDIKISVKHNDPVVMVRAYELLAAQCDYPLHLGVTEAGPAFQGTIKSAVAFGALLSKGIGDTIRVSLSAPPVEEVKVGTQILESLNLRQRGLEIVSCPSCGRAQVDVYKLADEVTAGLEGSRSRCASPSWAASSTAPARPARPTSASPRATARARSSSRARSSRPCPSRRSSRPSSRRPCGSPGSRPTTASPRAARRHRRLTGRSPRRAAARPTTPTARVLDEADEAAVRRLLDTDPVAGCVIAGRVERAGTARGGPRRAAVGLRRGRDLDAVCLAGANLIPFALPGAERPPRPPSPSAPAGPGGAAPRSSAPPARWTRCGSCWPRTGARPATTGPASRSWPSRGRRRWPRSRGCARCGRTRSTSCFPAAVAMFTEEVGVSPLRGDGGAGYRARVTELVRAGQSLAWIEDGQVLFKAEIGAVSRAVCQVQGVWVRPPCAAAASAPRAPPPSSSTPGRRSPPWSASTSTTSTPPPAPPTAGSASARSAGTPASSSDEGVATARRRADGRVEPWGCDGERSCARP